MEFHFPTMLGGIQVCFAPDNQSRQSEKLDFWHLATIKRCPRWLRISSMFPHKQTLICGKVFEMCANAKLCISQRLAFYERDRKVPFTV